MKELQNKMTDYKRFAFILLSLSVFLYIGSFLPMEGKTDERVLILTGGGFLLVGIALFFYSRAIAIQKKLNDSDTTND
ncbi:YrhC family protein [Alkalihalobacillus sp. R86527]|uniref:YrhC family protein n=1 Tax=Alkalihalobacillus sp. R86527 TaxID=3093863 RepID=UPI00366A94DD